MTQMRVRVCACENAEVADSVSRDGECTAKLQDQYFLLLKKIV